MHDAPAWTIRPADAAIDAEGVLDVYAPYVTDTAVSFEEAPPTLAEMRRRIAASHLWLVAEREGETIGYAYASAFHPRPAYRWSTEVSIYLRPGATRRGLGRTLLDELLGQLRASGYVNAFAGTTLPNPASTRLFASAAFARAALWRDAGFKLGRWHDVAWWQRQLRAPAIPPPNLSDK